MAVATKHVLECRSSIEAATLLQTLEFEIEHEAHMN
jgi:hypothetical protein